MDERGRGESRVAGCVDDVVEGADLGEEGLHVGFERVGGGHVAGVAGDGGGGGGVGGFEAGEGGGEAGGGRGGEDDGAGLFEEGGGYVVVDAACAADDEHAGGVQFGGVFLGVGHGCPGLGGKVECGIWFGLVG